MPQNDTVILFNIILMYWNILYVAAFVLSEYPVNIQASDQNHHKKEK